MRKLTILVDMDDTIENLCEAWVDFLNKIHGTTVHKDDIADWDMTLAFPTIPKNQIYEVLGNEELWKRIKPLPGAVEYLQRLTNDGHKVVVVTSASADSAKLKLENVLFKYFPFVSMKDVIIASQKQLIRGDVMVDDAPHNLEGGSCFGILFSAPHNRKYEAEANGFVRADNWKEVYNIVCDLARKE